MIKWSLEKISGGFAGLTRSVAVNADDAPAHLDLHFSIVELWRENIAVAILLIVLLLSAFGTIYIKDMNRRLMGTLQEKQAASVQLHNQYSQLLLEKSTWDNQARVQRLATQQGMVMPKKVEML